MEVDVVWTIVNCLEKKAALFFQSKFDKNVCFFVFTGKVGGICFDFDLIFKTLEKTKGQFE
jgi:hypothetical protein